jgi:PAS domain S-box-containing protein
MDNPDNSRGELLRQLQAAQERSTELEQQLRDQGAAQAGALAAANEALRKSEARFQAMLRSNPIATTLTRLSDGQFLDVNEAFLQLLGYERSAVIGRTAVELGLWVDLEKRAETMNCVRTGAAGQIESQFRARSGSIRTVVGAGTVVQVGDDQCVLAMNVDITERKRLQAQAAQADRLTTMGTMAAGVGHEINNPLTYVLHHVETLAKEIPEIASAVGRLCSKLRARVGPEVFSTIAGDDAARVEPARLQTAADRAREALDGVIRIKNVSRSLHALSRNERPDSSTLDLTVPIESALKLTANELKHRARVVRDFGRVPDVWASEGKLAQVFLNLFLNAAQAIDEGHAEENSITVRTWAEADTVCVEVSDTGVGIAPENLQRIFEPFFTTKDRTDGSGLGLSIAKNIVTSFGGDIEVASDVGRGTRFVVRLPVRRPSSVSPAVPSALERSVTPGRGRILVVDDEVLIREVLVQLLGRDHEVIAAASGREARALLEKDAAFDVILCDLMMADVTGMELHAWLVTNDPALAERTVFITGGAFTERSAKYLAGVGNPRIEKPFAEDTLKRVVSGVMVAGASHVG